jgi:hypothetical protein
MAVAERWLQQLRHHRQLFPALHPPSLVRLEYVLRCLAYMSNMVGTTHSRCFRLIKTVLESILEMLPFQ